MFGIARNRLGTLATGRVIAVRAPSTVRIKRYLGSQRPEFIFDITQKAEPLRRRILAHGFLNDLFDGQLDLRIFRRYMEQDIFYLTRMKVILSEADGHPNEPLLNRLVRGCDNELEMIRRNVPNLPPASELQASDVVEEYLEHIETSLNKGSLAAVAPCYWAYREVATCFRHVALSNNPYEIWVQHYQKTRFSKTAKVTMNALEKQQGESSDAERIEIEEDFTRSLAFELRLWEDAYCENASTIAEIDATSQEALMRV